MITIQSITKELFLEVRNSLSEDYLSVIEHQLIVESELMIRIHKVVQDFARTVDKTDPNYHELSAKYNADLYALIDKIWETPTENHFIDLYARFTNRLEEIVSKQEEVLVLEQGIKRFTPQPEDSFFMRIFKWNKGKLYQISRWPVRLKNIFIKDKIAVTYWKHEVPFQRLVKSYLQAELLQQLSKVTTTFFEKMIGQYVTIKNWEESQLLEGQLFDPNLFTVEVIHQFKVEAMSSIQVEIEESIKNCQESFERDYELVDTIEYPNAKLKTEKIDVRIQKANEIWTRNNFEWKNTIYALFGDWRSDLDIFKLRHLLMDQMLDFKSDQLEKMQEQIGPEVHELETFVDSSLVQLSSQEEPLSKSLKKVHYLALKKLDKDLVPRFCEKLSNQTMVNLINVLEVDLRNNVEELKGECVIIRNGEFDKPVSSDDLYHISTFELISFETMTSFQSKADKIKKQLFSAIETAADQASDLDHVVTFSLASALAALEEGQSEEDALIIAQEGFSRTSKRLTEIQDKLTDSLMSCSDQLQLAVDAFCDSLLKMTQNESVHELRIRITKAKAAIQAREVKNEIWERINEYKEKGVKTSLLTYEAVKLKVRLVSELFILTATKPTLTKEVSDFLLESQQAIDKLPLVYQRLFQIEPLTDLELFEGRTQEFASVKNAYENWGKGRYAATAIIGEKWGGLTSFVSYVIKKGNLNLSIYRKSIEENISTEKEFLDLMAQFLKMEPFDNPEKLISFLNEGTKKILVLEDLQNLYLRKVDGFDALKILLFVISKTYKNVFWVTTSTLYTWGYLSKTIHINEYFSYIIELSELEKEQIVSIIWKRNRISGYQVNFEVPEKLKSDKKFQKLNKEEQQMKLKHEFFTELNDFSKSNISLALIFWLLSTKEIDENSITIGAFNNPSLNFLKVFSSEKVYLLHALILHDGLSEEQLANVQHMPETTAKLLVMTLIEDGVVYQKGNHYLINPIVYRSMISLLKSKNLIH